MSRLLIFSSQALSDLESIGEYLLETSRSGKVADQFVDQLIGRCERLAALPGTLGRDRSELKRGIRSIAFGSYVTFFCYIGDTLEVVAVLEGHRDIAAYFDDDLG